MLSISNEMSMNLKTLKYRSLLGLFLPFSSFWPKYWSSKMSQLFWDKTIIKAMISFFSRVDVFIRTPFRHLRVGKILSRSFNFCIFLCIHTDPELNRLVQRVQKSKSLYRKIALITFVENFLEHKKLTFFIA